MLHKMLRASINPDLYFDQTVLLLHGDGTNGGQNNTFIDSSTNNFAITRTGNTTQGTFSPFSLPDGNWSNFFDGTGDWLAIADNAALEVPTQDFTVECFAYFQSFPSSGSSYVLFQKGGTGTSTAEYRLLINNSGGTVYLRADYSTTGTTFISRTATSNALVTNQWYHLALTRTGTTAQLWVNGVAVTMDSTTWASTTFTSTSEARIGAALDGTLATIGYISNFRLVKGTAVYTGNFTVPVAPLTAITNTSLLTCQSNRFLDNSSNAFTVTRNGDVRVRPFSPFSPSAAYSASINGGSGYFDGTGDYLVPTSSTIVNFGTGDFTIEFWVYPLTSGNFNLFDGRDSNQNAVTITSSATGVTFFDTNGTPRITGTTPATVTAWNHIAVTRSGTSVRLFLNGVQQSTTYTSSLNYISGTNRPSIGASGFSLGGTPLNGYMANVRVVKGTAVYTAAFTPPTAPPTAITNTSLLLNFTNAAIFDNAAKNDLETVGNAQISTSVTKFGTGSMSFDGTGDWLAIADNRDLHLGTGNFTIECWVYLNAVGAARGFVSKGTSTTGWSLSSNATNNVVFSFGSSTITSTGTLAVSTWYFITVVREGTGTNQTKIYINGTNDGTGTVSTDFNQTSIMYVGANRVAGDALNGYIDDLRITKGIARYTANFTAPIAPFNDR